MVKNKKNKKPVIFGFLFDAVDLILNFLPGKALTAMLIIGGAAGGFVGYDMGISSVTVPDCPICEMCTMPECPISEPCPECEDCKDLSDYTDEELIEALKPRYVCYLND